MVGTAQHDSEAVAGRIGGEFFVGDGGVFAQPILGSHPAEGAGELFIDGDPGMAEFSDRKGIADSAVGMDDEGLVELRVERGAEVEEREKAVVDGGEVAEEVVEPVAFGSDAFLEVVVGEVVQFFVESGQDLSPGLQRGMGEELFGGHRGGSER